MSGSNIERLPKRVKLEQMNTTETINNYNITPETKSEIGASDDVSSVYNQLGEYTRIAKYARFLPELGRRETWTEQCDRVMDMHKTKYSHVLNSIKNEIEEARRAMLEKKVLGSQRALQFGGPSILKKNTRIYNCVATYVDRVSVFQQAMFVLLCGAGSGFSVQKKDIDRLPNIRPHTRGVKIFTPGDSIEGWSDAIGCLVSSYFISDQTFPEYFGYEVQFDLSNIRPKGSPISDTNGLAPGSAPLQRALSKISHIFERRIRRDKVKGRPVSRLTPRNAYDILMNISDAVLSGGVRRCLAVGSRVICERNGSATETRIENVKVGDKIFTHLGFHYVTAKFNQGKQDTLCIYMKGRILTCTPNHKIAIYRGENEEFKWVRAEDINTKTDKLICDSMAAVDILDITEGPNVETYDIEVKDIHAFICEGVIVHNSASIVIFSPDDKYMLNSKTGNWFIDNPQRARSNNSALLIRGETKREDFIRMFDSIKQFGEPGFIWADNDRTLFNPCFPIDTVIHTTEGNMFISDLINKPFYAVVDGMAYKSNTGFVKTGHRQVYNMTTVEGFHVEATDNHLFMVLNTNGQWCWKELNSIEPGQIVRLHNNSKRYEQSDVCNFAERIVSIKRLYSIDIQLCLINLGVYSVRSDNKYEYYTKGDIKKQHTHNGINLSNIYGTVVKSVVPSRVCDVYDCSVENIQVFNANGFYVHNCVEACLYGYDEEGRSGYQACVSGSTYLLTKDGRIKIRDAVDKVIEIWNGDEWSNVVPFITGVDKELYRVTTNDGSYIDCTDDHRFSVYNSETGSYDVCTIRDTSLVGRRLEETTVVYNKLDIFTPSDGNFDTKKITIVGDDILDIYFNRGKSDATFIRDIVNGTASGGTLCNGIDDSIFSLGCDTIVEYLSGWIEILSKKYISEYTITSDDVVVRDLQLLFKKIGINTKIVQQNNSINDTRKITQMIIFRSDIENKSITGRLKREPICDRNDMKLLNIREKIPQIVVSVEKLNGYHKTYCLSERKKNMCLFGNILTYQCNLSEINMAVIKTPDDFYRACRSASILGTLQAGYTDFGYLGSITQKIVEREALLGVSMTGMMDCPLSFDPVMLSNGVKIVRETNTQLAEKLGIRPASRLTCIKPAGTTSCILNTANGIHPRHSSRYFRRVQANKLEKTLEYFMSINPDAVEESVWSANKTDSVITFLCKSSDEAYTKREVKALDLLKKVKLVQKYWVNPGTVRSRLAQPYLRHNVSNTINVDDSEWTSVADFIYDNRKYFTGVALLSNNGDKDYQQAPFQAVLSHEELIKEYGDATMFASGLIVHSHEVWGDDNIPEQSESAKLYDACACFLGLGEKLEEIDFKNVCLNTVISKARKILDKKSWLARAEKFTQNFFGDPTDINNRKKTTYCLKDIDALHKWCKLERKYKQVDWELFREDRDNTYLSDIPACAGGYCELVRL